MICRTDSLPCSGLQSPRFTHCHDALFLAREGMPTSDFVMPAFGQRPTKVNVSERF